MKNKIQIVLIAIFVFVFASSIIEKFVNAGLCNQHPEITNKLQVLLEDSSYFDAVFFGSSRTLYSINPRKLEEVSGKRVFNAGLEGAGMQEIYLAFTGYLANHPPPKTIYLMIDLHTFSAPSGMPIYTLYYTNFLKQKTFRKELSKMLGVKVGLWYYLPFTMLPQYSEYAKAEALKGLLHNKVEGKAHYNGYWPLQKKFKAGKASALTTLPVTKEENLQLLYLLLEQAKNKNIKVKVLEGVYLASFAEAKTSAIAFAYLRSKLKNHVDVQQCITFKDSLYFKDESHVNALGAEKYSAMLATDL